MEIRNQHERTVAAAPERITELIADFDRIWPTQIAPAPRLLGPGRYDVGIMAWEEFDRPGAARAFRVTRPDELRAERLGAELGRSLRADSRTRFSDRDDCRGNVHGSGPQAADRSEHQQRIHDGAPAQGG